MMRALRILESVCLAAFLIGVYLWAALACSWLAGGSAVWFEASVAVAGGAFCAGGWGVAACCARAILRTERNMREVRRRLSFDFLPSAYVDDASDRLTLDAMRRARAIYERRLAGVADQIRIVGDLRKGGAL